MLKEFSGTYLDDDILPQKTLYKILLEEEKMLNVTNHEGNANANANAKKKKSTMKHQLTCIRRATKGKKRREKSVGKDVENPAH